MPDLAVFCKFEYEKQLARPLSNVYLVHKQGVLDGSSDHGYIIRELFSLDKVYGQEVFITICQVFQLPSELMLPHIEDLELTVLWIPNHVIEVMECVSSPCSILDNCSLSSLKDYTIGMQGSVLTREFFSIRQISVSLYYSELLDHRWVVILLILQLLTPSNLMYLM